MKKKNSHWLLSILCTLLFASAWTHAEEDTKNMSQDTVRHIVVFKYSADATAAQIDTVTTAFRALKDKIPGIISFETGVNNSPEKLDQGFTHIYQLTFTDTAARDQYLPHPQHAKFGELLGKLGILEQAFVVDYVPQD